MLGFAVERELQERSSLQDDTHRSASSLQCHGSGGTFLLARAKNWRLAPDLTIRAACHFTTLPSQYYLGQDCRLTGPRHARL